MTLLSTLFSTSANLSCYWTNFIYFKRPNVEQIVLLSGLTGKQHSNLSCCQHCYNIGPNQMCFSLPVSPDWATIFCKRGRNVGEFQSYFEKTALLWVLFRRILGKIGLLLFQTSGRTAPYLPTSLPTYLPTQSVQLEN